MSKPLVSIVMGSSSDWEIMQQAAQQLKDFGVAFDARVISAHRSPDLLFDYIKEMSAQGVQCFIAGAGGAAHLAGVIAGKTTLPVLGVPIPSKYLKGMDSLLSIVQMPSGIPVGTIEEISLEGALVRLPNRAQAELLPLRVLVRRVVASGETAVISCRVA